MLGDFATAAALTVMRYEHQFSRALAEPTALSQLCVATAAVEPARSDALERARRHTSGPVPGALNRPPSRARCGSWP